MALSRQEYEKLPPGIARLLSAEMGVQDNPTQSAQGNEVLQQLQGALGRRFGQQYGADFDPEYDAQIRGLLGQVPQHQAAFANRRQRLGEDFLRNAEDLNRQNERAGESHLTSMADRGLGRSGANLVGQGRIAEQFQRGVQGLGQARQRALTDTAAEEAGVFQKIRQRQSEVEAAATERARVREERRRWEEEQQRMEQERLKREEDMRQQELQAREAERQAAEARLREVESAALAASQPMPMPTGGYSRPSGGGGAAAPGFNTDTNASVDFREYNLRDPNEVRELQSYLGLKADGIIGPQTISALQAKNAVFFDDRPIDINTRRPPAPTPTQIGAAGGGYIMRSGRK